MATKLTPIGKLESELQRLNKKLQYVQSRTERIGGAATRLGVAIQLLARSSNDPRDLK